MLNPIAVAIAYTNLESDQSIYARINDIEDQ